MCGIFGFVGSPDRQLLGRMAAALVHRGPDDAGSFERPAVSLGHRRLSIIDREGGHQPIANEDETIWLVYNGEVYNYRELHAELVAAGHVFRTSSDSEVIVHAYEEWGPCCAARFNGMWAFAIADLREGDGKLVFNRDHFGIKPLFYARSPQTGPAALRQRDQGAVCRTATSRRRPTIRWCTSSSSTAFTTTAPRRCSPVSTTCRRPPGWRSTRPAAGAGERSCRLRRRARPAHRTAREYALLDARAAHRRAPRPGPVPPPLPHQRRAAARVRGPRRLVPLGRPRLHVHRRLHERAAAGERPGRGLAARPAQDLQRRVRRRSHRRARLHRGRRREHRRRHDLHQP